MAITFRILDEAVAADRNLPGPALRLYILMLNLVNVKTREGALYISQIAKEYNRSERTVQRWLAFLANENLIERHFRKSRSNPRWNEKSTFVVRGNDAKRYADTRFAELSRQKVSPGGDTQRHPGILSRDSKDIEDTLRRENKDLPEEYAIEEAQPYGEEPTTKTLSKNEADQQELIQAVPEIMRTTAEYLLLKTGRTSLKPKEVKALIELSQNHTPARVQKEIDICVERFRQNGRKLNGLYAGYIATCLRDQKSCTTASKSTPARKNDKDRNKEAPNSAPTDALVQFSITERVLSHGEAESIISGYKPTMKDSDSFPTALRELYRKITPEMTLEEYLRLRHPEATEAELDTSRVSDWRGLQKAFEMDQTCASCDNPDNCPFNRKNGRPVTMVKYHRLEVGYTLQTRCKHDRGRPDPEFEDRVKRSGLSASQVKQTFEGYDHNGMPAEVVSAKAKAIMAAKNHTSLILSGKPGTGKTHLAVAIALEAMRGGKQALFRTVPELIAELRQADWDHADFFGLRQKFRDVPCLVLDDWGKEKATEKGMEYLYQIIDYRYRKGLQTVITTNGLKGDVELLVSRILENGEWVSLQNAENHRLKKAEKVPEPEASLQKSEVNASELESATPENEATVPAEELAPEPEAAEPEVPIPEAAEPEQNMLPEYDSPAVEDDGFRSIGAVLGGEKPRSGIYKYFPNYDRLDDYDKKQVALWCMQNYERLEAEEAGEATKVQQTKPEHDPAYDDEDLWKEDEDEYRLPGDDLYRPAVDQ